MVCTPTNENSGFNECFDDVTTTTTFAVVTAFRINDEVTFSAGFDLHLKAHQHRAKAEVKANIFFDVCHLFFDFLTVRNVVAAR